MVKRRRRKRQPLNNRQWFGKQRQPSVDLTPYFQQSDALIMQGQAGQAVELLVPLLEEHKGVAELHYNLGYAQLKAGNPWGAVQDYEIAQKLSRDARYWVPLAAIYLQLELNAHALRAYRHVQRAGVGTRDVADARAKFKMLEADVAEVARLLSIKQAKAEEGLYQLEMGMRALQRGEFSAAVAANQRSARILKNWPRVQNNLSLSLFMAGQPGKAIESAHRVLVIDPENIQALSNLVRFLTWSSRESEARERWTQLQAIQPRSHIDRWKMAEAGAILGEDQAVYDLLQTERTPDAAGISVKMDQLLGVAEANLGMHKAALRRLKPLRYDNPRLEEPLLALKEGKPGPGLADRYPYYHSSELLISKQLIKLVELIERVDDMRPAQFQKEIAHFVNAYPQIVLIGEKLIWEEGYPELGFDMLEYVGTDAAFDVLLRFGTSQAGDDELRRTAIFRLQRAGRIPAIGIIRMWQKGEWQDVRMHTYEIVEEYDDVYAPAASIKLNRGIEAMHAERFDEAERLFLEAIEHDPTIKQAYNNVAAIYDQQARDEEAAAMLLRAVEIDPSYVLPRVSLALIRMRDDDIEGAKTMLAPLETATRFTVQGITLYSTTLAQIGIAERNYDSAREALQIGLAYEPENESLLSLQKHMEQLALFDDIQSGWEAMSRRQAKRDLAKRHRMQTALSTRSPSLDEALALYTKEVMTAIGRVVITGGGWSTLRKAELHALLVARLQEPDNLERIVARLNDEDRDALAAVLAADGALAWQTFDERYGNDFDESPYWQYHEPESVMGRLRLRGLLTETTVGDELLVAIPTELRPMLVNSASLQNQSHRPPANEVKTNGN